MREQDDHRPNPRPARSEFARLSDFARRGTALGAPERIRALGARRTRRRRGGQIALGTGALAVVAAVGAGLALNGSGHGPGTTALYAGSSASDTASAGSSVRTSHAPTATATPTSTVVLVTMPGTEDLHAAASGAVLSELHSHGFKNVSVSFRTSDTVPKNNVVDVVDWHGRSVAGRVVSTDTPVTVVVSNGPAD
jgi:hypothetical protein